MGISKRIKDKMFINYQRVSKEVNDEADEKFKKIDRKLDILNEKICSVESTINKFDIYHSDNLFNKELLILTPTSKKKILIVGFYGAPNLGDELMLQTILQYFPDFKNIELTIMLADNPNYDIDKYPAVNIIHYPKTKYDFNYLAKYFDVLIFGGGAIIDDKNFLNDLSYQVDLGTILIKLSEKFITWGKDIYCVGLSSVSTFSNSDYTERLSKIIDNSKYFSVRDSYSQETLKKYCKTKKAVILSQDIVFANKKIKSVKEKFNKVFNIGIVWIPYAENVKILEDIIEKYSEKYKIHLIPFYGYKDFDISEYKKMLDRMKVNDVIIEHLATNMEELIEIYNKCDFLISMRYHGVLVGKALQIPTLSICYDNHRHYNNKMKFLAEVFDDDRLLSVSSFSSENLDSFINETMDKYAKNKNNAKPIIKKAQQELEDVMTMISENIKRA